MAWDIEHIRHLLDEVASTSGHASAQKSEELLNYVTNTGGQQEAGKNSWPDRSAEKAPDECRIDGK